MVKVIVTPNVPDGMELKMQYWVAERLAEEIRRRFEIEVVRVEVRDEG